jgi:hypothetical protein
MRAFAAGSTNRTSDYDITFELAHVSHKMDEAGAIERGERRRFGRATYSTAKYEERVADVVGGEGTKAGGESQELRSGKSTQARVYAEKDVRLASKLARGELDVLAREVDIVRTIKGNKDISAVAKEQRAAGYGPEDVGGRDMVAAFLSIAEESLAPYYTDKYRGSGRLWAKGGAGGAVETPSVL